MDQDTTRMKGSHDRIVSGFETGSGDILLGTQMVSKGHDFPNVTLVGIISADTSLHFPDFRAGERTFQLLTQAAGRAGRRIRQGEVVIQTFQPDHPVLKLAAHQDFDAFYTWEAEQRKMLSYPPWGRLILIRFSGASSALVESAADSFHRNLPHSSDVQILGPAPAPLSRIKSSYRFQILLKVDKNRDPAGQVMRRMIRHALEYYRKARFSHIRLQIDVDPVDVM